MPRSSRFLLALLFLCLVVPALAETLKMTTNSVNQKYTLKEGDRLEVLSNYCNVTVDGSGGQVRILGNYNNLIVVGKLGSAQVLGNYNTVKLTRGLPEPKVERLGNYNQVEYLDP